MSLPFETLPTVAGMSIASAQVGIRSRNRLDVMLAAFEPNTSVGAVFTKSLCPSAPVDWCRSALSQSSNARALIVNSGNANAFTGAAGATAVTDTAGAVAEALSGEEDVSPAQVYVASTGVIGENLPTEKLTAGVHPLVSDLAPPNPQRWLDATTAIGTTDTFPKVASASVGDTGANVVGIAKGSGMIAPDMATMLAFIFTDVELADEQCQGWLSESVATSFNRITVDADTSTSDMAALFATGASGVKIDDEIDDEMSSIFQSALDDVTLSLAKQIVRDGEGATKFVAVTVTGAADTDAAVAIGKAIGDSPLVKTALAAEDANWGRIVAAVGKSGQKANRDALAIWIGDEQCASNGTIHPNYSETNATSHLQGTDVNLTVDVGVGDASATIWTCDLTHGYIDINAGYRT